MQSSFSREESKKQIEPKTSKEKTKEYYKPNLTQSNSSTMATTQSMPFNNSAFRSPEPMHLDNEMAGDRMNATKHSIGGPSILSSLSSPSPKKKGITQSSQNRQSSSDRSEKVHSIGSADPSPSSSAIAVGAIDRDGQPVKKRTQSCDICRIRKVKCIRTEEKGKCKQCGSNDADCTYTYVPKKPGPQTSSAKAIARKEEKDRQIRAAAAAAMLAKGMGKDVNSTRFTGTSGKEPVRGGKGLHSSGGAGSGIESGGERSSGSSRRSSIPGQPSPALFQHGHPDTGMHDLHFQRPGMFSAQSSSNVIRPENVTASNLASSHPSMNGSYLSGMPMASSAGVGGSHSTPSSFSMQFDNSPFFGYKSRPGSPSLSNSLPFGISPASSSAHSTSFGANRAACLHSNQSSISGLAGLQGNSLFPSLPQSRSASSSRSSSPRLHRIQNTLEGTNPFIHAFTPIHPIVPSTSGSAPHALSGPTNPTLHHSSIGEHVDHQGGSIHSSSNHSDPAYSFPWPMPYHAEASSSNKSQMTEATQQQPEASGSSLHPGQTSVPSSIPSSIPMSDPASFMSSSYNYDPIAMSHQLYEHALQWQHQQQQQQQQQQYRYHQQNQQGGIDIDDLQSLMPLPTNTSTNEANPSLSSSSSSVNHQNHQRVEQWPEFWNFPSQNSN